MSKVFWINRRNKANKIWCVTLVYTVQELWNIFIFKLFSNVLLKLYLWIDFGRLKPCTQQADGRPSGSFCSSVEVFSVYSAPSAEVGPRQLFRDDSTCWIGVGARRSFGPSHHSEWLFSWRTSAQERHRMDVLGAAHISRLLRAQVRYFKCRRAVCTLIMEATRSRCDALIFSKRVRAASR